MSEPLEPREAMEFDVLVVGAGPGGLSAAIRLKQLNRLRGGKRR
jgi:electron-transferring-flavoprotein dehydrogenase